MPTRCLPFAPALIGVLMLATATDAGADTLAVKSAKPAHAAASQPPATRYATRDQLRECMGMEDALKARRHAIEAAQADHAQHMSSFEAESAKIVEVEGQLDHDSDTAINAFNLLVSDHNVHVKTLNQEVADSRAATDAYNADTLALNRQCAALVYKVDDMDAVMKERRQAGK